MNIQSAALMVRDGLLVRRTEWNGDKHLGLDNYGLYVRMIGGSNILQIHFHIHISDLMANDWEVYPLKKTGRLSLRTPLKAR